MNWWIFLAAVVATWCGVDVGIAIIKKDYKEIAFNAAIILFEWCFILFNWGV